MRRLYLQIYLTFVGVLFLFGALVAGAWLVLEPTEQDRQLFEGVGALAAELLPPRERANEELEGELARIAALLRVDLAVWTADGALVASVGEALPRPQRDRSESYWIPSRARGLTVGILLPDGRWLIARHARVRRHAAGIVVLGLLALAIAVGAYPLVRRITRRIERLRASVEELGAGDFSSRVKVEGRDEVADLARSFNSAAEQIEQLVHSQKRMFASASHELRSPLARIRIAMELLDENNTDDDQRADLRSRVAQDIGELDELIAELLLASKLDTVQRPERPEPVDLLVLAAEEASRFGFEVRGEPLTVSGDRRLLRRLVRNLLENAHRHAGESPVDVLVTSEGSDAYLSICDRGPGISDDEKERVFQPFYRIPRSGEPGGGVGLGLTLVRQIARHHSGDVRCVDRDGPGVCFEVRLPCERVSQPTP